ncbi:MAG: Mbeg1-like protein [Treponema sp.]
MATMSDYLTWRGDIPFSVRPFNELDALILCQLSYADFTGIIPRDFHGGITLAEAAAAYHNRNNTSAKEVWGVFINPLTAQLLAQAGQSERFGGIVLKGFIDEVDIKAQKQFAAYTAMLDRTLYCVVFRGTDDSLIGWKEDFLLTCVHPIAAQKAAADYVTQAAAALPGSLLVAGHSKGGNLAVYAGAMVEKAIQKRIHTIFCYDGPGFHFDIKSDPCFQAIIHKIASFIPQSSVVGILLSYPPQYTIVRSSAAKGILQHDLFSWQVETDRLITCTERTKESVFIERTVATWLSHVELSCREGFVNTLFDVVYATGAATLTEFNKARLANFIRIAKELHTVNAKTKKDVIAVLTYCLQAARLHFSFAG